MRIVFMGTPEFAVPALEALQGEHEVVLVVTQPDKPAGRKKRLQPPPVKVVAEREGISLAQPASARTPEFLALMAESNADVAVVVAYGKLLPKEVLAAFPHGCINIHGSLLPKYRGAAPIQRAILNGDTMTGVSIMLLDEGMDTGPVFLTRTEAISEVDTAGAMFERLAPLGARAVCDVLQGIEDGTMQAQPQSEEGASHAAMLKKKDGLIDWSRDAANVSTHIRGMDPWPGAFTPLENGNLKLFGARVVEESGEVGSILGYHGDAMTIACGDRAVQIQEVQAPGKKRMGAAVYARGRRAAVGEMISPTAANEDGRSID